MLKEATVVITSRPHACAKLTVNRKIEVVGFGIDEIKEYVEKSLTSEPEMVTKLLKQLEEYPHLLSICYVPMSLAMVGEIFSSSLLYFCKESFQKTVYVHSNNHHWYVHLVRLKL